MQGNGIVIRAIDKDEFEDYAKVHSRGTGLPDQGIPSVASNNRVLYSRPGWSFYMAYVEDEPATGVMYVNQSTASLTFAATLPEYRRQGLLERFAGEYGRRSLQGAILLSRSALSYHRAIVTWYRSA